MASDKKNLKLGNFTSPRGKAKYPKLNAPDTKFKADGEYSVKLVFLEDSSEAQKLVMEIDAAYAENSIYWRDGLSEDELELMKDADKPYRHERDKDTKKKTGNIEFKFGMRASGMRPNKSTWTQQPDLFDAARNPLPASVSITGGSTIRVSYFITGWCTPQLGSGVSCKLKGVQLIELAGYNGSAEDQGFEEEEGYSAPASDFSAEPASFEQTQATTEAGKFA